MQRSFDDLGTPLADVTFVVLDLETTGGSPTACAITEIGALKFRGGECLGTFQTLVNPGVRIPHEIVYLTGITEAMVGPAPIIEEVLPTFAEFIGDSVIVGHNVRFDLGFLRANLKRLGYRTLTNTFVDTCALARRLVRDEVPNCKLSTLARHFRTVADPCHRALDDARATAEVFHALLERAAGHGVVALDDLIALPKTAAHPQVAKLRWVASLPRSPGVYLFRDGAGRVLYVGRAVDLRRRVRTYFSSDDRRKIGPLLREAQSLDHIVCVNDLEAAVLEVRLIHQHLPRFNRQVKVWSKYRYVKLSTNERFPRLSVVRSVRPGDGAVYLGPLASAGMAKLVIEAIETVVPLRRCTTKITRNTALDRDGSCAAAQLGVATCPCAGAIDEDGYRAIVERAALALTSDANAVLRLLRQRMERLAAEHRFEEAADVRERAATLSRVSLRQSRIDALVISGRVEFEFAHATGGIVVDCGRLVSTWAGDQPPLALPFDGFERTLPLAAEHFDEVACVASWLGLRAAALRIRASDYGLVEPVARPLRFERSGDVSGTRRSVAAVA